MRIKRTHVHWALAALTPSLLLLSAPREANAGFCNQFGCINPLNPTSTTGGDPVCPSSVPVAPLPADSDPDESAPSGTFISNEMATLSSMLKAEWNADAAARAATQQTSFPCYVAFIHGSGIDDSMYRGPSYSTAFENSTTRLPKPHASYPGCSNRGSVESQESYWVPPGHSPSDSMTFRAGRQHWPEAERCMVWRVAYDGRNRTFAEGAMQAATELTNFINRYNIQGKKLTIVTHSMGGLVGRFILNNAAPTSPYANGYFATVASRTKAMITIQAPHAGSQAADAVYGEADHYLTNVTSGFLQTLGVDAASKTRARQSMRRAYIERAAGNGGWLADAMRATPMYLIAGRDVRPNEGGNNSDDDKKLKILSESLCYTEGAANVGGALCSTGGSAAAASCLILGWLAPACLATVAATASAKDVATDGMVETDSALGFFLRDSTHNGITRGLSQLQGAHQRWAVVQHNHNHGRWDLISRDIDVLRADNSTQRVRTWLGTFIADFGIGL